jgi:formyltetrahydrofolate synthetase
MLPGVRLTDEDIIDLANVALCDCLWVLQKLENGELIAAQHVLHSRIVDTNLRLLREVRIRESLPLPSFGLGRKLEILLKPQDVASVCVSSLAQAEDLERGVRAALEELQKLARRLCPDWRVSPEIEKLIAGTGPSSLLH